MRKLKKFLALFLSFVLILSMSTTALANTTSSNTGTSTDTSTVLVTDDGIYIDGIYYTQAEFTRLLDTAIEIERPATRSVGALVAGTWWIPGVGEVVITAAGVILVGGAVIAAGTWIYDTITEWFANRAINAYEDAKENGEPTDDHSTESGSSLPTESDPLSSKDLVDSDGSVKQRRYYGENGKADMDIDYHHGGTGHTFPHRHDWNNGVRGSAY